MSFHAKRKILLSSAHAATGQPNDYIIQLPADLTALQKIKGFSVADLVVSNTQTPVNVNKNTFFYSLDSDAGTILSVTIADGSYTATEFSDALKSACNSNQAHAGNNPIFSSIVPGATSYKLTFTVDNTNTTNVRIWTLGELRTTFSTKNLNQIQTMAGFGLASATSSFQTTTIISNQIYDMGGDRQGYLHLSINNNSTTVIGENDQTASYSFALPSFGSTSQPEISQTDDIIGLPGGQLPADIQVWLTDIHGVLLQIFTDYSFSLNLYY